MASGVTGWVLTCMFLSDRRGSTRARTAATSSGMCAGAQPAITAFTAMRSTVAMPMRGVMTPAK